MSLTVVELGRKPGHDECQMLWARRFGVWQREEGHRVYIGYTTRTEVLVVVVVVVVFASDGGRSDCWK